MHSTPFPKTGTQLVVAFVFPLAGLLPLAAGQDPAASLPEAEIRQQVKLLDPMQKAQVRQGAVTLLLRQPVGSHEPTILAAMEQCIARDPDPAIRVAALEGLAFRCLNSKRPCPLVIIETMTDREDSVSDIARSCANLFESFAPGCLEVLLRQTRSENQRLREATLYPLAHAGRNNPAVLKILDEATRDAAFSISHNAQCARFRATDDLEQFLTYLVWLQEDSDGLFAGLDLETEAGKRERELINLAKLGGVLVFEWAEKRPEDLARVLLKLLGHASPPMRRGAARLIGAAAVKVENAKPNAWSYLFPAQAQEPKPPPQPSRAAPVLVKSKARERLQELAKDDPDLSVRAAARMALDRIESVLSSKGGDIKR